MDKLKTNYHSHTIYCRHSTNTIDDLIKSAISNGFNKFGISEHMTIPTNPKRNPSIENFLLLVDEINIAKKKYKNEIEVYFGLECEYFPGKLAKLVESYFNNPNIDFLIYGNHFYGDCYQSYDAYFDGHSNQEIVERYYINSSNALNSRLFSCFNHPDIFVRDIGVWDQSCIDLTKKLIELSINTDTPLEFNINGLASKYNLDEIINYYDIKNTNDWEKIKNIQITDTLNQKFLFPNKFYLYPFSEFWKLVSNTNAKVIIGIDTHKLSTMDEHYRCLAKHLVNEWGINDNLVDDLKLKHQLSKI